MSHIVYNNRTGCVRVCVGGKNLTISPLSYQKWSPSCIGDPTSNDQYGCQCGHTSYNTQNICCECQ